MPHSLSLWDIIPLRYESFSGFPDLDHTYYLENRCKCFTFLAFFCCVMDVFEWLWMWVLDGWVCVGDPLMRWVSMAGWFWWGGRGPPFILNSEVFLLVWKSVEVFLLVSIWAMSSDWSEPDVWILRDDWSELSHASLLVRTWWLNSSWVFLSEPWALIGQNLMS